MNIEEKARAYDKAIEKIKYVMEHGVSPVLNKEDLQDIFPELKESEDEMMVKFIKKQLFNIKKTITENYELDTKLTKAIDWLEKQGKQKSIDDLTPQEAMDITVAKCFESGGVCTNPLMDCNDCLNRFDDGTTITTSQTILKDEK